MNIFNNNVKNKIERKVMEKQNNIEKGRSKKILIILIILIIIESIFLINLKKETQELYFVQSQEGKLV